MPQLRKKLTTGDRVACSHDGTLLVCRGSNVVVFNVADRSQLCRIRPFPELCHVAFSPSSHILAVKSTSGRIATIDPDTGIVVRDFRNGREGQGSNLLFSPDGSAIVDGSEEGFLTVRNASDGKIIGREHYPSDHIRRISHDSNGSLWLIEHQPRYREGQDTADPNYLVLRTWPFAPDSARILRPDFRWSISPTISPGGEHCCFVGMGNGSFGVYVMSLADGQIQAYSGPTEPSGTGDQLAWSQTGEYIGSIQNRKFVIYRAADLSVAGEVQCQYPSDICFLPDNEHVALGTWNFTIFASLVDLFAGKVVMPPPPPVRRSRAPRQ